VNTNPTGGLVLGASTQLLTEQQIQAILDLLRSFNADQSVVDSVSKTLHGQAAGGSSTGVVFSRTLSLGSRGDDVAALQKRLTLELVYTGPIIGIFGPLTLEGVKKFQLGYKLPPTGLVGPLTLKALNGQ
jgi:peptidoglycan hydrolase-like protein with peptidoglycan-binding domain